MKCPYCGEKISNDIKYCSNCGQEVISSSIEENKVLEYWNSVDKQNSRIDEYDREIENKIKEEQKKNTKKFVSRIWILLLIVVAIIYGLILRPSLQYNKALSLMQKGNYKEARNLFESLKSYKTSEQELEKCDDALTQMKYENAVTLFESGDIETAMSEFNELEDYSDSEDYYTNCEMYYINQANEFETVTFGKFEGEDIKWIVLKKTDSEVLLITESYIANEYFDTNHYYDDYNDKWVYYSWSKSTLREWLNGEFMNSFNNAELQRICESSLLTDEFETENYEGFSADEIVVDTVDRVYIPAIEDVWTYSLYTSAL